MHYLDMVSQAIGFLQGQVELVEEGRVEKQLRARLLGSNGPVVILAYRSPAVWSVARPLSFTHGQAGESDFSARSPTSVLSFTQ